MSARREGKNYGSALAWHNQFVRAGTILSLAYVNPARHLSIGPTQNTFKQSSLAPTTRGIVQASLSLHLAEGLPDSKLSAVSDQQAQNLRHDRSLTPNARLESRQRLSKVAIPQTTGISHYAKPVF